MNTLLTVLAILAIIPYVLAGAGGYFRRQQFGHVDNISPRAQYASLEGAGAFIYAAQQNAWEALGLFTATVAIAGFSGTDMTSMGTVAWLFLATRIVHPFLYVTKLHILRSIAVVFGLGCSVCIIWQALCS